MSSLWGSSADLLDTIKQGDVLNSSQYLVSANRKFTLGYFKPTSQYKNNSYFAIWYTNVTDNTVWIGNRDRPISNDSTAFLTLDHLGKLMINSSGFGGDPFVIYSGGQTENTISDTLLDTGNLVAREVNSNGSIGRWLWESFDHPTDTLLPGMKLGVNHKTGRNWSLTSWLASDDPASGAFTLEWEPKTSRLIIKLRGVPYWSSGRDSYGYGMEDEGCERWNQPKCRSHKQNFQSRSGGFVNSQGDGVSDMRADDDTANLSPSVSREYCWNDRDCLAYGDDAFGPGCHIWKGKLQFVQDFSGRSPRRYVIITEPKSKK
nr:g-type lectin s-receptor-like serine/threonine-protein kinase [Quercus suber]